MKSIPSLIAFALTLLVPGTVSSVAAAKATSGSGTEQKWFPGHYLMVPADTYTTDHKAYRVLKGDDGRLFVGLLMYVTWGQIETDRGAFQWDKIDRLLAALPPGKKFAFSLSWQGWRGVQACPQDMLTDPRYDGGQRVRGAKAPSGRERRGGVNFATIHLPATMDRYLAFAKAFAARYDSDPRLAFVTSAEIPYDASLKVGQFNEAKARASIFRLAEMVGYFPHTPCGVLGAWWSFGGGDAERDRFARAILEAGGGFGFPDLDGNMTGSHYRSAFRPHVLANAGQWPCWMGVEFADLMPERAGPKFPDNQIESANLTKTNFIWWITSNRRKDGGYDFDTDVLNALRANPTAGITTARPARKN